MMPMGTTLSRWTMSYFGAALIFLLLAESLLTAGMWQPSLGVAEPRALIIVHSTTIGWLGLLMIGALLQFAPVITGLNLPAGNLGLACLVGIVLGLTLLLSGFGLIEAGSSLAGAAMSAAALTLAFSILSIAAVLFSVLWQGRRAHQASPLVLMGIASLAVTATLGAGFAVTMSGVVTVPAVVFYVTEAVPLHASFGLVGWMTFAAIGVSYKLLPMFLLSQDMKMSSFLRWSGMGIVGLLGAASVCLVFDPSAAQRLFLLAALVLVSPVTVYIAQLFIAYRRRRRKTLELNASGSLPAFVLLGVSVALFPLALVLDARQNVLIGISYLFVFGWLSGLGLAQLLKIVPFLTWIEAFGPLLGRRPTPRLGDLVSSARSAVWLAGFYAAVIGAASAIALGSDSLFRFAAAFQFVSTAALAIELARARALSGVAPETKASPFQHPAFFFAANHRGDANGSAS